MNKIELDHVAAVLYLACCAQGSRFTSHPGTAAVLHHCGTWSMASSQPRLGCPDPLSTASQPQSHRHVPPSQPPDVVCLCPDTFTIPGIPWIGININREAWSGQKVNRQLKFFSEGLVLLSPKFTLKGSVTLEPILSERSHAGGEQQDGRDLLLAAVKLCSPQKLPDFMQKHLRLLPINCITALFPQSSKCLRTTRPPCCANLNRIGHYHRIKISSI